MYATLVLGLLAAQTIDQRARDASIKEALPQLMPVYRWLHENPELSTREEKTAAKLAEELKASGAEVVTGVGGHGVLAALRGSAEGPTVLFRTDMDALPVAEATGLGFASKNGAMHACGHDIHMTSWLGTLRVLAKHRDKWKGTVLFIAQPAEEIGTGARAMLADAKMQALLKKIGKPKVALALHDSADLTAGTVEIGAGWMTANVESIDITVHGLGGHGARPETTVDPIVIGSEIVLSLQTIVSRRVRPGIPAVITVGQFTAGTKHNIIPPSATLLLTVRSFGEESRKFLVDEIRRTATQIARAHNAPKDPDIKVREEFTPASFNDPEWSARLDKLFRGALGKEKVSVKEPTTGGEDFAEFARGLKIPGVMWWIGAQPASKKKSEWSGLHSDKYAPDAEPAIQMGIQTSTLAILEALAS